MTLSDFHRITDELLSAYIDDEVTEQERALVEAAIAQDEEIAWRLKSLRHTVVLLRDLPEMPLPRSFTLTLDHVRAAQSAEPFVEAGVAEQELVAVPAIPAHARPKAAPARQNAGGFWQQVAEAWHAFWQGGNPILRNAAAVSFALMLVIAGSGQLLNRALQPAGMMATSAPAAAPASSEGASAAESVALVPTAIAEATEAEPLQAQAEIQSSKVPVEESAPASDTAGDAAASNAVAESATAQEEPAPAAAAAVAEADSGESATAQDEPAEEPVAAAAAVAANSEPLPTPGPIEPPMAVAPFPGGMGGGGGGDGSGGGPGGPPMGGGAEAGGLVPQQAYEFDVNPGGSEMPPAEEAVSASVAAAPAAAAAASSTVADVAATPAVEPVGEEAQEGETAAASVAMAEEPAATEMPAEQAATASDNSAARSAAPTTAEQAVTETAAESTPTPEAVALVATGPITSSAVVENVETEGTTSTTSVGINMPVIWIAQGSALLLTIVFASLWWRSRSRLS